MIEGQFLCIYVFCVYTLLWPSNSINTFSWMPGNIYPIPTKCEHVHKTKKRHIQVRWKTCILSDSHSALYSLTTYDGIILNFITLYWRRWYINTLTKTVEYYNYINHWLCRHATYQHWLKVTLVWNVILCDEWCTVKQYMYVECHSLVDDTNLPGFGMVHYPENTCRHLCNFNILF